MNSETVLVRREANETRITINRPARRNALNREVAELIIAGIAQAEADADCRVIVLTGAGDQAFCAGGDIKAGSDGGPFITDPSQPGNFAGQLIEALNTCRKPTLARVNGAAVGGGAGIVCACDVAVMADHARIGTPEAGIGLFPLMIMPPMMRMVPRRRLLEMFLTGVPLTAEEALRYDVVNYVTDAAGLDAKVAELVARISAQSPTAIRMGKYAYQAMDAMSFSQQMRLGETLLPRLAQTEDAREGFAAFVEKRKPNWTGR